MPRRSITRRHFSAYDPDLWLVQSYLTDLGFDPGGVDGLWGSNTRSAAEEFATSRGLDPSIVTDEASVVSGSNLFGVNLLAAARDAGLDMTRMAPGTGAAPALTPKSSTPSYTFQPETIVGTPGGSSSSFLPLALLGVGALYFVLKK